MLRRIIVITFPVMVVAIALTTPAPKVEAGGFAIQVGGIGIGGYGHHGHGHRYGAYRVPPYGVYLPGYRAYYGGHHGHHPRGRHLDYYGPRIVPHGRHFDVVPGHYHLHHRKRYRW